MQITEVPAPGAPPLHHQAAIHFHLRITDGFVSEYGGNGDISIAGQPPQAIQIKQLAPDTPGKTFTFRTGLWRQNYTEGDKSDEISGGFEGSFAPNHLTLERTDDDGYAMKGELHKGTDDEYRKLVQQLSTQTP